MIPALFKRIVALGYEPGTRNPEEWTVSELEAVREEIERLKVLLQEVAQADLIIHEACLRHGGFEGNHDDADYDAMLEDWAGSPGRSEAILETLEGK